MRQLCILACPAATTGTALAGECDDEAAKLIRAAIAAIDKRAAAPAKP